MLKRNKGWRSVPRSSSTNTWPAHKAAARRRPSAGVLLAASPAAANDSSFRHTSATGTSPTRSSRAIWPTPSTGYALKFTKCSVPRRNASPASSAATARPRSIGISGPAAGIRLTWRSILPSHELAVTTDSIVLEARRSRPLRDPAGLEPDRHPPGSPIASWPSIRTRPHATKSVTHPHVQDERLCEGDGRAAIAGALSDGRLYDFFTLVSQVLHTYGKGSAYVELDRWDGVLCDDCGDTMDEDDRYGCQRCDDTLCPSCAVTCQQLPGDVLLASAVALVRACGESYCSSCLAMCRVAASGSARLP